MKISLKDLILLLKKAEGVKDKLKEKVAKIENMVYGQEEISENLFNKWSKK